MLCGKWSWISLCSFFGLASLLLSVFGIKYCFFLFLKFILMISVLFCIYVCVLVCGFVYYVCLFVCNSLILLLLVLLGFNELMNLIYHQFEVDWSSSVGAIVNDIFGPGFAFDVDEYTSCVNYIQQRNIKIQLILHSCAQHFRIKKRKEKKRM